MLARLGLARLAIGGGGVALLRRPPTGRSRRRRRVPSPSRRPRTSRASAGPAPPKSPRSISPRAFSAWSASRLSGEDQRDGPRRQRGHLGVGEQRRQPRPLRLEGRQDRAARPRPGSPTARSRSAGGAAARRRRRRRRGGGRGGAATSPPAGAARRRAGAPQARGPAAGGFAFGAARRARAAAATGARAGVGAPAQAPLQLVEPLQQIAERHHRLRRAQIDAPPSRTSRRGVGRRDASSTARAQRSKSTGDQARAGALGAAPAPRRSPPASRRPGRRARRPAPASPRRPPRDRAGSPGTTARAARGRRRDRPPAR